MKLLFIRHADPDYVHDSLTEEGFAEAKALGKYLSKQKIDYVYCSPLGRAKDTMQAYLNEVNEKAPPHEIKEWLHEFKVLVPHGANRVAWDFLPEALEEVDSKIYSRDEWLEKDNPWANEPKMKAYVEETIKEFDALLEKHGYKREGSHYVCSKSNVDVIAFFCHFGIEAFLLSHLMNCSPVSLWQHTIATPSSVTTVYTEERREGHVLFRVAAFGETAHLALANMEPAFSGRFSETIEDPRRHD
ncbi:MAG: phosphoglycerate mutase family protein [Bacilli bacterium]|nr:phosphoglycerate mutase family protein [Bacilli bacterium]